MASEFISRLTHLYGRWQDEKKYENIEDYLKSMQEVLPTASKMTKRPFGVIYENGGETFYATAKAKGKGVMIEIKTIESKG